MQENLSAEVLIKASTYRYMGVSGISLGIGSGEDGVDEHESADNLSTEAVALGVAVGDDVGAPALGLVEVRLEAFDNTGPADSTKALHHNVENCSGQRQFSC